MNLFDTIRGLGRRWYISIPGVVLAVVAAVGMWQVTPAEYQRSASQLLLPGPGVLPEGATNRFLFMGGLAPVADVLIRAMGSDDLLHEIYDEYPGVAVEIVRDPFASGPVVQITVTARSDAQVGTILEQVVELTGTTLERLQSEEGIPVRDRVTVTPISMEQTSTIRERNRIVTSAAVGLIIALMTVVAASVVDGLASRAGKRRERKKQASSSGQVAPDAQDRQTDRLQVEMEEDTSPELGARLGRFEEIMRDVATARGGVAADSATESIDMSVDASTSDRGGRIPASVDAAEAVE